MYIVTNVPDVGGRNIYLFITVYTTEVMSLKI